MLQYAGKSAGWSRQRSKTATWVTLAALQQRRLDLGKQEVKYGAGFAPARMLQRQEKCEWSGESMGKTASSRTVKKAVHKMSAEPANNNRRRHNGQAVRLVNTSNRTKRPSPAELIVLPEESRPAESEPFMNERHKIYFRNKLIDWKEEIVRQNRETLHLLHEDSAQHADFADRATSETDRALELRA